MPTGTGKSITMGLLIERLQVRTLVIVPNVELKRQLRDTFDSMFQDASNIVVENIDSPRLKDLTDFDCLILDEAHHAAASTYRKLNKTSWNNIYYRYFFSATFFRNQPEEELLFASVAGVLVYELTYADAVKQQMIVPVEAYYIEIPSTKNSYHTYAEVYSNLVVKNDMRNNIIALALARLNAAGLSSLCLVKEVAHGAKLEELTGVPFANGKDNDSRRHIQDFNSGKIKSLIGTEGIIGEGVDTKPCEYVIISGLGKAKSAFLQKVGRAVRTFPGKDSAKVIIIKDKSHRYTLRHFNAQVKILRDYYGVTPSKLEL